MRFQFFRLRFHFRALDLVCFPPGKSGNVVRGAFGSIFRGIACDCPRAHAPDCPYARVFEPRGAGPSGLADRPRPFVFRAAHLDGRALAAGDAFHFDVHLFDTGGTLTGYFIRAFAQLGWQGLGPGRGRAQLLSVEQLQLDDSVARRIVEAGTIREQPPPAVLELDRVEAARRVRVRFVTPTELKSGQQLAERPEFGILFGRARDRISTLRALYGAGPLEIDFRETGHRAAAVKLTRCDLQFTGVERRSGRTGQVHPIGGFVGLAEYEGELGEFLPYLRAARWTGVGRQTVWGKGEIAVEVT